MNETNTNYIDSSSYCIRKAYNIRNFDKVVDMKLENKGVEFGTDSNSHKECYKKMIDSASSEKTNEVKEVFERVSTKLLGKNLGVSHSIQPTKQNNLRLN